MSAGQPLDTHGRKFLLDAWRKYRRALDRACRGPEPRLGCYEYEEFRRLYVAFAPEVMAILEGKS